jgi:hypothetical protein
MDCGLLLPMFWRGIPYPEDGGNRDKIMVDKWTSLTYYSMDQSPS